MAQILINIHRKGAENVEVIIYHLPIHFQLYADCFSFAFLPVRQYFWRI